MKRYLCSLIISLAVILGMAAPAVQAQDTSPYLMGYLEQDPTPLRLSQYFVVNPTVRPLSVYAAFYDEGGAFLGCRVHALAPNATWYVDTPGLPQPTIGIVANNIVKRGTVKFFAFPLGSTRYDPNAVIGGFQRYIVCNNPPLVSDMNLKAVTINSSTLAEFRMVLEHVCFNPLANGEYESPEQACMLEM